MAHPRTRRATAAALTVTLAGLVLATGCGSDHGTGPSAGAQIVPGTIAPVQSGAVAVSAIDNNFQADAVTVTAGSTVTWTNAGRNDHNVKPVEGTAFGVDTSAFRPGASYSATFTEPGTYHYFCSIHGTTTRGMVGTVEVVAK